MHKILAGGVLLGVLFVPQAYAETASVAVAANFTAVAEKLAEAFKTETGDEVTLSFGATGALYTQISQGAPFDILLAADDTRPAKAVADGLGVEGSVFTYAIGSLALYSTAIDVSDGEAVLKADAFAKIAIADPKTAPYGLAAIESLTKLGLLEAMTPKFVTGENITQTLQFVDSGNAEIGFVAASQVIGKDHVWIVPAQLHEPINQDAVLLKTGAENKAATDFLDFLKSDAAMAVIEASGYSVK
ncbi:molybdate ABC transporter substrate-binding protein [uncultured Devosia sp.]|uniref:molybdate ABC transporter substrate-binding protein n=1 Tax=uncultured Devosia sp. TaxID=211434 RepID=UPI0035CC1928